MDSVNEMNLDGGFMFEEEMKERLDPHRFSDDANNYYNVLINEAEWSDIRDVSFKRASMGLTPFDKYVHQVLNGKNDQEADELTKHLETRRIIAKQITLLLNYTRESLHTTIQLHVMETALKCNLFDIKACSTTTSNNTAHCLFNTNSDPSIHETFIEPDPSHLVKVTMISIDEETSKIIRSPCYVMDIMYATILRAWNVMGKFHYYLDRIFQASSQPEDASHISSETMQVEKTKDSANERLLLTTMNYSSRFLYNFFKAKEQFTEMQIRHQSICSHI